MELHSPRLRVGLIGAGRAGSVIARSFDRVGHHCVAVTAVSEPSKRRAAQLLPSADILDATEVCATSDLVIVAVPDAVITEVVSGLVGAGAISARHIVMHLSGRYGTEVLAPAEQVGAMVIAAHPAMTLRGRVEDVQRIEHCPFGVTAQGDALPVAQALVYEIGGTPVVIGESDRTLYHAALAHASNHSITLIAQAMELLERAGIDAPGEFLMPLVSASAEGALRDGDAALTGPVARGDFETVHAHVEALTLSGVRTSTVASYVAMAKASADRHGKAWPEIEPLP